MNSKLLYTQLQTWKKSTNWNENRMYISRKENTYWKKQWHMNLCLQKQLFLCNFIQNIGTRSYFTRESLIPWRFPNPPANSFPPICYTLSYRHERNKQTGMEKGNTFHVKKIHIERRNDTWISILRNNSSSATLFITQAPDLIYNREPQPLKISQPPS